MRYTRKLRIGHELEKLIQGDQEDTRIELKYEEKENNEDY